MGSPNEETRKKQYDLLFKYFTTDPKPTKVGSVKYLHENGLGGAERLSAAFYRVLLTMGGKMPTVELVQNEMKKRANGKRVVVDVDKIRRVAAKKAASTKKRKMIRLPQMEGLSLGTQPVSPSLQKQVERIGRMMLDHAMMEIQIVASESGPPVARFKPVQSVIEIELRPS